MNKKIVIILALMITSTTTLFGCNSTAKTDSSSTKDTTVEASSIEEANDTNSNDDSEENKDENKNESENKTESNSSNKAESNNTNKENKKTTQSSNNSTAPAKKADTVNKQSNTTASAKKEEKPVSKKATTFTAKAGYTLTFPANWEGKYIIDEQPNELNVRYKCSTGTPNPPLFCIVKVDPNDEWDNYDTVGNIKYFNIGNTKYRVGGPTDCWDGTGSSKDFEDFLTINRQKGEVVNSLKVIK